MPGPRLTGSCLCGAVRYETTAEPTVLYACHCSDCQTSTGSAFVLALRLPAGGVALTSGPAKHYLRERTDGRKRNIMRCTACLTALWSESLPAADYVTVYAGTLDDSPQLIPDGHIWAQDAQPWIVLPKDALVYQQGAPDLQLMTQARIDRKAREASA